MPFKLKIAKEFVRANPKNVKKMAVPNTKKIKHIVKK
jgi:hypothetical protein